METSSLLWSLLFGSAGLGYFIYGRKQDALIPTISGVALMVYPYFVNSTGLLVVIGALLLAAPFFIRR
jgi:hypothetical protein